MARTRLVRDLDKVIVRLPDGMRDQLKAKAAESNRSVNAEIVQRLDKSLTLPPGLERALMLAQLIADEYDEITEADALGRRRLLDELQKIMKTPDTGSHAESIKAFLDEMQIRKNLLAERRADPSATIGPHTNFEDERIQNAIVKAVRQALDETLLKGLAGDAAPVGFDLGTMVGEVTYGPEERGERDKARREAEADFKQNKTTLEEQGILKPFSARGQQEGKPTAPARTRKRPAK